VQRVVINQLAMFKTAITDVISGYHGYQEYSGSKPIEHTRQYTKALNTPINCHALEGNSDYMT